MSPQVARNALAGMPLAPATLPFSRDLALRSWSDAARERLLSVPGEPLFIADWELALMIHYEVNPESLQHIVPFELDLRDGRAYISLVAFRMRGMRPRFGGQLTAWLAKPIATHDFLNVRTYVRAAGETGIYFLAEWLSNRLSVILGPPLFGLPYRLGKIAYHHFWERSPGLPSRAILSGRIEDAAGHGVLAYNAVLDSSLEFCECATGSLDEWLMERYTAFTHHRGRKRFFRVWHPSWLQVRPEIVMIDQSLLKANWPLFNDAQLTGANFSPGVQGVWMGRPRRVGGS
jgi:uncharacterized protein YqjF (DUF2071 family)